MHNSKAENLAILATIPGINIPEFMVLSPGLSEEKCARTIRGFLDKMPNEATFAVRSSAEQEDSANASFAGMYITKLHIAGTVCDIWFAMQEVRASMVQKKEVVSHYANHRSVEIGNGGMSVVVQRMINADMSGVVFSHNPTESDGYYSISISRGVGETIVGGASNGRLIRIARGVQLERVKDTELRKIVSAMRIIEQHFQSSSLDVEFAFQNGTLYILQCRPITTAQAEVKGLQEEKLIKRIDSINAFVETEFQGDVLGDMIDINPAELLGVKPTTLDISIFNYLFADCIVERVRRDMGYDPLGIGLVRVVARKPYTSMCATAYSFRPFGIPDRIYERMVTVYRNTLVNNPALQSRVEFDLYAMSCGDKLELVMQEAELCDSDKRVVRNAFSNIDTVFLQVSQAQAETFDAFTADYEQRIASMRDATLGTILEHVAAGTEMFVRVARLAFYWKNRFEEMHPKESLDELMAGCVHSTSAQLQADLIACRKEVMSREELVRQYGHLRPGQFSVFGESYADDPETYLFAQMEQAELVEIEKQDHDFSETAEFKNVVVFMQARERMKFLFSHSLHIFSERLKLQLAQRSISQRSASSLSWSELCAWLGGSVSPKAGDEGELVVLLPDVIIPGQTDLAIITFGEALPSYVTNSIVKARVCVLERSGVKADVRGSLVLLPNADPGYDFLFHSGAVGIITKVGGPASHMCIRAIELQMPSCIGCGESMYQKLVSSPMAILNCNTRQIIALK